MVAAYARAVGDAMPFRQRLAVMDGVVTLAEYEAAIQRYYACVADAGMTPNPEPARGLRPSTFGLTVPDGDGVPDKGTIAHYQELIAECDVEHLRDLNTAWAIQQAAMPRTVVEESVRLLEACLASEGVHERFTAIGSVQHRLTGVPDDSDRPFHRAYFGRCRLWVEEQTGYGMP